MGGCAWERVAAPGVMPLGRCICAVTLLHLSLKLCTTAHATATQAHLQRICYVSPSCAAVNRNMRMSTSSMELKEPLPRLRVTCGGNCSGAGGGGGAATDSTTLQGRGVTFILS